MTTAEQKRLPIFGVLALAAALVTAALFYYLYRPPDFFRHNTQHVLSFSLLLVAACGFCGYVLAAISVSRGESFWIFTILAVILNSVMAMFFFWTLLMLVIHHFRHL